MRAEEKKLIKEWAAEIPPEHRKTLLRYFETLDRLQERLDPARNTLTRDGLIDSIEDAQHAAQDFITAAQAFAAYLGLLNATPGGGDHTLERS